MFKQLVAILLIVQQTVAVEWWFDEVLGLDSNPGTEAQPFKYYPGDIRVTPGSNAANATQGPGTTNNFSTNGYSGIIMLAWDGSAAQPIYYQGKSSSIKGLFDSTNLNSSVFRGKTLTGSSRKPAHLVFRNLILTNVGGYRADDPILLATDCTSPISSPRGGTGWLFENGSTNIVIYDVICERFGQWRNSKPFSGVNAATGTGIEFQGAQGATVSNSVFKAMKTGIGIKTRAGADYNYNTAFGRSSDILLSSNIFQDNMQWLIDIAPRSVGTSNNPVVVSNLVIANSIFNNMSDFDQGNWIGCGDNPHSDGIFHRTAAMDWYINTNIFFRNLDFFGDRNLASVGMTAAIYLSQGSSATIEGCIFSNVKAANCNILIGYTPEQWQHQYICIRHNTHFGPSSTVEVGAYTGRNRSKTTIHYNNLLVRRQTTTHRIARFETNIVYNLTNLSQVDAHYTVFTDYNAWSSILTTSGGQLWGFGISNAGQKTFTQFKSYGFEANGFITQDPGLAFGTDFAGRLPSTLNYSPIVGSVLINAGTATPNVHPDIYIPPAYPDRYGTVRHASTPTIGAIEFVSGGGSPPNIPTSPAALALSSTQIQISWVSSTGSPITYHIQRKLGIGGTYADVGSQQATDPTVFISSGLTASTTYYFRIRAENANGASGYSSEVNATTDAVAPPIPISTNYPGRFIKLLL